MLERLTVKGFQAHTTTDVELTPVTSFVGPTDAGKSSLLRALRWLGLNQPSGEEFVREGHTSARASVTAEGVVVGRRKGGGKNLYTLGGKPLNALGAGKVPGPVEDVLRVSPLNFQGQLDAHFWFSLSPGQVARELNAVVDLGVIDEAAARAAAAVRRAATTTEVAGERFQAARQGLRRLHWVRAAGVIWASLVRRRGALDTLRETVQGLGSLLEGVSGYKNTKTRAGNAKERGTNLLRGVRRHLDQRVREGVLRGLLQEIEDARRWAGWRPDPNLIRKADTVLALREGAGAVGGLLDQIREYRACREKASAAAQAAATALEKKCGGRCPTCGGRLSSGSP